MGQKKKNVFVALLLAYFTYAVAGSYFYLERKRKAKRWLIFFYGGIISVLLSFSVGENFMRVILTSLVFSVFYHLYDSFALTRAVNKERASGKQSSQLSASERVGKTRHAVESVIAQAVVPFAGLGFFAFNPFKRKLEGITWTLSLWVLLFVGSKYQLTAVLTVYIGSILRTGFLVYTSYDTYLEQISKKEREISRKDRENEKYLESLLKKYVSRKNLESKIFCLHVLEELKDKQFDYTGGEFYTFNVEDGIKKGYSGISALHKWEEDLDNTLTYLQKNIKRKSGQQYSKDLNNINNIKKIKKIIEELKNIKGLIDRSDYNITFEEVTSKLYENLHSIYNHQKQLEKNVFYVYAKNNLPTITVESVLRFYIEKGVFNKLSDEVIHEILQDFNLSFNGNLKKKCEQIQKDIKLDKFEEKMELNPQKKTTVYKYEHLGGLEFEEFLEDLFRDLGYLVAQTKKTGDQGADLIVMKEDVKIAVQAKKYANKVSNSAVQQAVASIKHYDCDKAIVVATNNFTKSAKELALSNNVELWNKSQLDKKIEEAKSKSPNNGETSSFELDADIKYNDENQTLIITCPNCKEVNTFKSKENEEILEQKYFTCQHCSISLPLQVTEKNILDTEKVQSQADTQEI